MLGMVCDAINLAMSPRNTEWASARLFGYGRLIWSHDRRCVFLGVLPFGGRSAREKRMRKYILALAVIGAFVSPALALTAGTYYVGLDTTSHTCSVVTSMTAGMKMMGKYKSKEAAEAAMALIRAFAIGLSVTFTASTRPANGFRRASAPERSPPLGGLCSRVTAKRLLRPCSRPNSERSSSGCGRSTLPTASRAWAASASTSSSSAAPSASSCASSPSRSSRSSS